MITGENSIMGLINMLVRVSQPYRGCRNPYNTLEIYNISYWKCLLLCKLNTAQSKGLDFLNKKEADNSKLSLTIVKVQLQTQGLLISFSFVLLLCNISPCVQSWKKMFFLKLHELCRCF